jgi:Xaa-Pro aminopeptidase
VIYNLAMSSKFNLVGGFGDYRSSIEGEIDYASGYGQFAVDFEERINMERLRKGRLERAREKLFKEAGLGAFLALDEKNIIYITSTYRPYWTMPASGLRYALLTSKDDAPILFEQGDIGYHIKRMAPWIPEKNFRYAITGASWIGVAMGPGAHEMQRKKMVEQIKTELRNAGVLKEPLGIDFYDEGLINALKKEGIEVEYSAAAKAMIEARKIKLKEEIALLKIACMIGDAIFQTIADNLRAGLSEYDVLAMAFYTAYKLGAEVYNGMFVTSGPYTWPNLRFTTGRLIRPGDVVYFDTYNMAYQGYRTCYYRTFFVGRAPQSIKDAYKRAYDWLYEGIKAIGPGKTTKDIAEKWPPGPEVWGWYGVENEDMTAGNNWAHGIGLSLYEPPVAWRAVSLDHPIRIEPGMTFAIETQEGDKQTRQGVRLEEMLVVTESGVEIMTKWPIDEITEVPVSGVRRSFKLPELPF